MGQRFCLGTGQRPRRWLNLLLVHATGGKKNRILDVDVYSHMFPVQPDCWARPYKIIGTTSESCYNIYIQNTLLTGNNNLVNKLFFSNCSRGMDYSINETNATSANSQRSSNVSKQAMLTSEGQYSIQTH